ncbi:MAG: hypothetical protein QOG64_2277, partial [Acidimicrobiaceae bacterium]|nr:hypothetical protein [Acidimicrobiaceae bacterium]
MKVSLDVSAVPARPVGAGRYTVELAKALAAGHDLDVALTLLTRHDDVERWAEIAPRVPVVARAPDRRPARLVWEQTLLPRLLNRLDVEIHHGPHYTMPEAARLPKVVTVHDLTFFSHPEWHERTKVPYFRRAVRVAARHADAVICVSEATASELRRFCQPTVPVHVVPHGVDHALFRPGDGGEGG